jgi:hypothetical protein
MCADPEEHEFYDEPNPTEKWLAQKEAAANAALAKTQADDDDQ